MWKRKEDEKPIRGATPAPEPAREGIPMSTFSSRPVPAESRVSAVIGKSVSVKGQISSREDLVIDGEVEGSINLPEHRLTVGPSGKVRAGVKAKEIVVLGEVTGDLEALDLVEIRKEARLNGDIKTVRIMIEDGAFFKGSIDIVRAEAPKPVTSAATAAPAAAAVAQTGGR
jgi:cytoskeletal protein CcmA (bactofilin family)